MKDDAKQKLREWMFRTMPLSRPDNPIDVHFDELLGRGTHREDMIDACEELFSYAIEQFQDEHGSSSNSTRRHRQRESTRRDTTFFFEYTGDAIRKRSEGRRDRLITITAPDATKMTLSEKADERFGMQAPMCWTSLVLKAGRGTTRERWRMSPRAARQVRLVVLGVRGG
jgi:hypothetical protein